ncbi:MAG: EAL domain-containing protein [Sulfuritalea sp.]|nr:EAL domain-containing protein [Sulfuritalea sp.]
MNKASGPRRHDTPPSTESPLPEGRRGIDYLEGSPAQSRFIRRLQWAMLLVCALAALGVLLKPQTELLRLSGVAGFVAVILATRWALRYGAEPAIKFLSLGLWSLNSLFIYMYAGIHSANVTIYPFLVALAGWALGIRWLLGMTAATVGFLMGLGLAEFSGMYQPTPRAGPILVALVPTGVLIAGAYLVYTIFINFANGRDRLIATGRQLEERNAELLENNAALTESRTLIEHVANHDALTNLPNRRLLTNQLQQVLASGAGRRGGALLFIDLDDFKTLNDTLGHDIGDRLLKEVAARLGSCISERDIVARFGGDEFVVMLTKLGENGIESAAQAEAIGRSILARLNQPYQLSYHDHYSTPSIGIVLFGNSGDTIESIDELFKQGDLAMYQAKAAGRNTLRFFEPNMQALVMARAELEAGLREAVTKEQFCLYYQAQVDGEGRLTGAEALIRWQHPERGVVSPAEFIPLAEETGVILPLGHWVLQTACRQLAKWAAKPDMAHLTIAVNISARQFRLPNFVEEALAILDHHGANPQRLKMELTESVMVEDVEDIVAKMTALKARGVGFSLDDFGTGYSSLSYLKRLPLHQLKIDQSFVRDILSDPNDAAIAKMVVVLAASLGLAVIAEGVETEAQRDFLARQGCHACQGYLFSRPLPLEEFEALRLPR